MPDMDYRTLYMPPGFKQALYVELGVRVVSATKPGKAYPLLHIDDDQCRIGFDQGHGRSSGWG